MTSAKSSGRWQAPSPGQAESIWLHAEGHTGRALDSFIVAALHDLGPPPPSLCKRARQVDYSREAGFDTFEGRIAACNGKGPASDKSQRAKPLKKPVTVTREAKAVALGGLRAISAAMAPFPSGPPAAAPITSLMNGGGPEEAVLVVQFLQRTTDCLAAKVESGALARVWEHERYFAATLFKLHGAAGGHEALARLYTRFLKCMALFVAYGALEEKVTLNHAQACWQLRVFGALPGADPVEPVLDYLRGVRLTPLPRKPRDPLTVGEEDVAGDSDGDKDSQAGKGGAAEETPVVDGGPEILSSGEAPPAAPEEAGAPAPAGKEPSLSGPTLEERDAPAENAESLDGSGSESESRSGGSRSGGSRADALDAAPELGESFAEHYDTVFDKGR